MVREIVGKKKTAFFSDVYLQKFPCLLLKDVLCIRCNSFGQDEPAVIANAIASDCHNPAFAPGVNLKVLSSELEMSDGYSDVFTGS